MQKDDDANYITIYSNALQPLHIIISWIIMLFLKSMFDCLRIVKVRMKLEGIWNYCNTIAN